MEHIIKDIFISYRNDGSGNQFAHRLCQDLESHGYSVYFNPNEERANSFPERLKHAVADCKDFLLILSLDCLEQLKRNDPIDWVREELLTAKECGKHIIPILLDSVKMPKDASEMPEQLRFLPFIDAIYFPEQYLRSPFSELLGVLLSKNDGNDVYKYAANNNPLYNATKDFCKLREEAEAGDVSAMYEVGMMCFYTVASKDSHAPAWDFDQAAYWLKKVSKSTSDLRYHADYMLGRMYYRGIVPAEPQSYEKAYQYYKASASHDAYSAIEAAFMQRIGSGCEFNYNSIIDFYKNNIDKGDDLARMELANFYTAHGRYKEALDMYMSMQSLSPQAEYQIGLFYKLGIQSDPPEPDYIQAAYYLRNAADNNHVDAAYEYAAICFNPTGNFRKNFKNAEKYFTLAAEGGHSGAQYILGYMYQHGIVTKDLGKAIKYLELSKDQGHALAPLELSFIYQQPECLNYQHAYECAKLAASYGVAEAELVLGNLLFWGRGCQADINKAYEMYTKAFEHGQYYASVMLEKIKRIKESY